MRPDCNRAPPKNRRDINCTTGLRLLITLFDCREFEFFRARDGKRDGREARNEKNCRSLNTLRSSFFSSKSELSKLSPRYVLYLINNEQVMLTKPISLGWCMDSATRTTRQSEHNSAKKKENLEQSETWKMRTGCRKLIYRISDNKFNSLSLPSSCSPPATQTEDSSLLFTYMNYTLAGIFDHITAPASRKRMKKGSKTVRMQLPHIIDDRNGSYVKWNSNRTIASIPRALLEPDDE